MNEITISSMLPAVRNTALMRGKTYIGIDFGTSTTVVSTASYDEYDHKIHTKSFRLPQMLPDGTLYRSEIVPGNSVAEWTYFGWRRSISDEIPTEKGKEYLVLVQNGVRRGFRSKVLR